MAHGDYEPLDVYQVRLAIKAMAAKHKFALADDNSESVFTMALALSAAVKKTFFEKSEIKFSDEPTVEKKPIIQFKRRMRIDALEKYNDTTVFSAVHFYQDVESLEKKEAPLGVIIVYLERRYVPEILRLLKYPYIDDEEEDEVKDGCGTIANLLGGHFKKELIGLGYRDLEMSPFKSFINLAVDGIEFPFEQPNKYELSFQIDGVKRMVVEMVMGYVPR